MSESGNSVQSRKSRLSVRRAFELKKKEMLKRFIFRIPTNFLWTSALDRYLPVRERSVTELRTGSTSSSSLSNRGG